MKIGIDARLYGIAGLGRYVSNLIEQLEKLDKSNEYIIFVSEAGNNLYHPKNTNFKKWVADYPLYSIKEQTNFLIDLLRARLDLLHIPHFNIPVFYHRRFVVTIHDLIMDGSDAKSSTIRSPYVFMAKKFFYKTVRRLAATKSKKILVPSEAVKKEILENIKSLDVSKLVVTYEGVAESLVRLAPSDRNVLSTRLEQMKIKDRYFLYVGSAYPHKNLETLVISFKQFLHDNPQLSFQLVIAGKIDDFSQRLAGFVHALKLDNHVIFAAKYSEDKYVSDKDLAYLYKGAMAYVFPSLKEGFSITPLEAQSFGIPALISDIPTHREIFKDSVLYFNPKSPVELTKKLYTISFDEDLRRRLVESGKENAGKYSWESMGRKTLEEYMKAGEY